MKRNGMIAAILMALLIVVSACSDSSAFEYSGEGDFATLTIIDDEGNILLEEQRVGIGEGATVFDCTRYLLQENKMQYDTVGAGSTIYMRGIDNLYERDKGPESGWLYRMNGSFDDTSISCALYPVENGDQIAWIYTVNLGADAGAEQNES